MDLKVYVILEQSHYCDCDNPSHVEVVGVFTNEKRARECLVKNTNYVMQEIELQD